MRPIGSLQYSLLYSLGGLDSSVSWQVLKSMPDDKYVSKHEWEIGRGKLHERINEIDQKHTENYNKMLRAMDRQTLLQENALESQKKSENYLETMSGNLKHMIDRVVDLEYRTKDNEDSLASIKKTIDEEKKGNREFLITWIGVVGLGISPLMTFLGSWLFR